MHQLDGHIFVYYKLLGICKVITIVKSWLPRLSD